jgi:DUF4097 and DUF4098 domain-containing protein YvlB
MHERILYGLIVLSHFAGAQTFTETTTRELSFEKKTGHNALVIANIHGNIKVEGHAGDKVLLEITRSIQGKTQARLEQGKAEIQTGVIDRADTLIVYVKDRCHEFARHDSRKHNSRDRLWGYQSLSRNNCHPVYDYKIDFVIKVPRAVHLILSTINDGDLEVQDVDGVVTARNINGSIRLTNLKSESDVHTINGDVDVEYAENPDKECRFYTLNGNINALFPSGLSADLSFESFNGSFYINIAQLESLPLQVQKSSRGNGLQYKVNGNRYQVGNGGPLLDFETFNGNVYLKEKTQ